MNPRGRRSGGPGRTLPRPPALEAEVLPAEDDWRHAGACARHPHPDLFFPPPKDRKKEGEAKAVCVGCPVRATCLEWALNVGEEYGVWGGLSEDERRAMKRRSARLVVVT